VTSRASLRIRGEWEYTLPPLALPDLAQLPEPAVLRRNAAVRLFLERARAVAPSFTLTPATAGVVAAICVRLDGLPLTLELAAGWLKLLSPQTLLARLERPLDLLVDGARDLPERQRTLRATLRWSYDLLDAGEQALLRMLAVFAGGWTLEAAEACCSTAGDPSGSVLQRLASLVDKHLLWTAVGEGVPAAGAVEPRFRMLETVREYALERLGERGEAAQARQRHAACYLALAERAESEFWGPRQRDWADRLDREHDNLRAALQWAQENGGDTTNRGGEIGLRLVGALWRYWLFRGRLREGQEWLERCLAMAEGDGDAEQVAVYAKVLQGAGAFARNLGDNDRAATLFEASVTLYRGLGDTRGLASALGYLAAAGPLDHGDRERARTLFEESLALWRELGNVGGIAYALSNLGQLAFDEGEEARAGTLFRESLSHFRALGDARGVASALENLGCIAHRQGALQEAAVLLEESLSLSRGLAQPLQIARQANALAAVARDQGKVEQAERLYREIYALCREQWPDWGVADALCGLADLALDRQDHTQALALYLEGLALAQQVGTVWPVAGCLDGIATVSGACGRPARAARLWGAAAAVREGMRAPQPLVDRTRHDRAVAAVRAVLGEEAFAVVWAEGRALPTEAAVALALEGHDEAPAGA
jgi:predicted ATPase